MHVMDGSMKPNFSEQSCHVEAILSILPLIVDMVITNNNTTRAPFVKVPLIVVMTFFSRYPLALVGIVAMIFIQGALMAISLALASTSGTD